MKKLIIKDCKYSKDIETPESIVIIIENKQYLFSFIENMILESDENPIIIVDDNEKELKFIDYVEVISSIFNLDFNKKQNITSLVKLIKNINYGLLSTCKVNVEEQISLLAKSINIENEAQICTDINISEDDIIKLMNIKIYSNSNLLKVYIFEYIKTIFQLRKIKTYVIYSLLNWLEEKEVEELLKSCMYLGITIIDIEHANRNYNIFNKKFLLDKDLCFFLNQI